MSYKALFGNAASKLLAQKWGAQIEDKDGKVHDTGVQKFVEEFVALLTDPKPIEIDEPVEVINRSSAPAIRVLDAGGSNAAMELFNQIGQMAKMGIGTGNQGLVASALNLDPNFEISPFVPAAYSPVAPGGLGQFAVDGGGTMPSASPGGVTNFSPIGRTVNPFSMIAAQGYSPLYGAMNGPWAQGQTGLGGFVNLGGYDYRLDQFDPLASNFDSRYGSGLTLARPPSPRFAPTPYTAAGSMPTPWTGPVSFPWQTGQGAAVVVPVTGTATGGSSTTLLGSGFAAAWGDGGTMLGITGGTGSGQWRPVSAATSDTLTVSPAWATAPDATSVFAVYPFVGNPGSALNGTATGGSATPPGVRATGAATAATASTLTDSAATFNTAWADFRPYVSLTNGTGSGQIRPVTALTGTQLTVEPDWDTNPDATTNYALFTGSNPSGTMTGAGFHPGWPAVGAAVGITDGTGAGQWRPVTAVSGDTLTVQPGWDVAPDSTSVFTVRVGTSRGGTQIGWSPDGSPIYSDTLAASAGDAPPSATGIYPGWPRYGTRPPQGSLADFTGYPFAGFAPDLRPDTSGQPYPFNGGTPRYPLPASMLPPFVTPETPQVPAVTDPSRFDPDGGGLAAQLGPSSVNGPYGSTPPLDAQPPYLRPNPGPARMPQPNGYNTPGGLTTMPGSGSGIPGYMQVTRPQTGFVSNLMNYFNPMNMGFGGPTAAAVTAVGDDTLTVQPYGFQQTFQVARPDALQRSVYDNTTDANGLRYTYQSPNSRTFTNASTGVTGTQYILPNYNVGDTLWMQFFPNFNTQFWRLFNLNTFSPNFNFFNFFETFPTNFFFVDLNMDNRIWVTVPDPCEQGS